uniref:Uncharacterized protein n=1 Tax=Cannabis sativa TaxID=3483 RepID=A0A803PUR6_CANSA
MNCRNREASDLIRQFNERTARSGQDVIRDHLQGRLIDRSSRVYRQVDIGQTVQPGPSCMRTDLPLPEDRQSFPNRPYGKNNQFLAPGGFEGRQDNSGEGTLQTD